MTVLADLAVEFGIPWDAWRRMPWPEFQAWVRELGRRRDAAARAYRDAQQAAHIQQQRAGW